MSDPTLDPEWRGAREGESQPMPTTNDLPHVHQLMINDIQARMDLGTRRYGTPLQPHNGRNALLDAYEELLDLGVYLRQHLFESEGVPDWVECLLQSWLTGDDLDFNGCLVPPAVAARIEELTHLSTPRASEIQS